MGVPGFHGEWITKNIRHAVVRGMPRRVSSLLFDLNGIIHKARMIVYHNDSNEPRIVHGLKVIGQEELRKKVMIKVCELIEEVLQTVNPTDLLVLAVDGVAPAAKLQQQRGRRERSSSSLALFDRNAITPGTEFMIDLDAILTLWIQENKDQLPTKIIYSSHLVPGEGEHKIMDLFRDGTVSGKEAHVVYGLDADLYMLTMLTGVDNILLIRENLDNYVVVDEIKRYLLDRDISIDDFIVMMFFAGNDFLPHQPSLEDLSTGIEVMLSIYTDGQFRLTVDGELDTREVVRFAHSLAANEGHRLAERVTKTYIFPSDLLQKSVEDDAFHPERYQKLWNKRAFNGRNKDEMNKLLAMFEMDKPDIPTLLNGMVHDYLKTMAWNYLYYKKGHSAVNTDWLYAYYHAPLLNEVALFDGTIDGFKAFKGMIAFTALHQLIAVTPFASRAILPIELQLLTRDDSPIKDIYIESFINELDGKDKEHLGVPIIPIINRRRIVEAVGLIPFTKARADRWLERDNDVFTGRRKGIVKSRPLQSGPRPQAGTSKIYTIKKGSTVSYHVPLERDLDIDKLKELNFNFGEKVAPLKEEKIVSPVKTESKVTSPKLMTVSTSPIAKTVEPKKKVSFAPSASGKIATKPGKVTSSNVSTGSTSNVGTKELPSKVTASVQPVTSPSTKTVTPALTKPVISPSLAAVAKPVTSPSTKPVKVTASVKTVTPSLSKLNPVIKPKISPSLASIAKPVKASSPETSPVKKESELPKQSLAPKRTTSKKPIPKGKVLKKRPPPTKLQDIALEDVSGYDDNSNDTDKEREIIDDTVMTNIPKFDVKL